ncbi:MAG: ferric reductase-like transmembrane domain-containing protein [Gammaproteobacteria bacterium]
MTPTTAGLVLGWLGAVLLAASLILMVREPSLAERLGGLERMYRWHHRLGTLAYVAVLAHPLVIAVPTWTRDSQAAWLIIAPMRSLANFLGWLSVLTLMGGLAVTFALRLRYSLWRPMHALLSLGVVLGAVHIAIVDGLSLGISLFVASMLLALSWRFMRADRGAGAPPYEVIAVTHATNDIVDVTLRPLATSLNVTPGQFVMVAFFDGPHFRGCGELHPYTVSATHKDGAITLSIKSLGDCTRNIQELIPGVAARVQGPFGRFLADRPAATEIWIAGGVGITPFLAVLRASPIERATDLFYVFRQQEVPAYLQELKDLAERQPLLKFHPVASQDNLAPLLSQLVKLTDIEARMIYMCGPPPLVDAVADWLHSRGIASDNIHFERFDFR